MSHCCYRFGCAVRTSPVPDKRDLRLGPNAVRGCSTCHLCPLLRAAPTSLAPSTWASSRATLRARPKPSPLRRRRRCTLHRPHLPPLLRPGTATTSTPQRPQATSRLRQTARTPRNGPTPRSTPRSISRRAIASGSSGSRSTATTLCRCVRLQTHSTVSSVLKAATDALASVVCLIAASSPHLLCPEH